MTRFDVSDKFAGKEGPCPKCKKVILVPGKEAEVVIHAPDNFGPKDQSGRAVLKPIFRKQSKVTPLSLTIIGVTIVGLLLGALIFRLAFSKDGLPGTSTDIVIQLIVALGSIAVAVPVAFGGYSFLRDQDKGAFSGKELWIRVAICSLSYGLLWASMWVSSYAFTGFNAGAWLSGMIFMLAMGAVFFMYIFEIDYLLSLVHFGLYFAFCLLLRFLAGLGLFPGQLLDGSSNVPADTPGTTPESGSDGSLSWIADNITECLASIVGLLA